MLTGHAEAEDMSLKRQNGLIRKCFQDQGAKSYPFVDSFICWWRATVNALRALS